MKVRIVSLTRPGGLHEPLNPEDFIVYTARVSSPQKQEDTATAPKLIRYLIRKGHWSPFEMVDMTVEIVTSRAISAQILRHRSFSFQEFSQRYAPVAACETYKARAQDKANRQNSIDNLPISIQERFEQIQKETQESCLKAYDLALQYGIAKECARFLLPMSAQTTLYMKGSVRSWIHYLQARTAPETQLEHREIALAIQQIFNGHFPNVAEALREAV